MGFSQVLGQNSERIRQGSERITKRNIHILARPAYKKECYMKEFLETNCYSDEDCQQCLNTSDGYCKNFSKCAFKKDGTWQLEVNKNFSADSE